MRQKRMIQAAIGVALLSVPLLAVAQQKFDLGKREYEANCAVCHGMSGKGDGPFVMDVGMMKGVADLTQISKRNHGWFPAARVYEVIDGREAVKAHGPRDMPIWGADYRAQAPDPFWVVPYDPETFVRIRILALMDYVARLQEKEK